MIVPFCISTNKVRYETDLQAYYVIQLISKMVIFFFLDVQGLLSNAHIIGYVRVKDFKFNEKRLNKFLINIFNKVKVDLY